MRATAARASGDDGKIRDLEADIVRNEAALTAYERSHAVFTRMGVNGLPTALPDYGKASVPRTGMAFGADGPNVEAPAWMRSPRQEAQPEGERPARLPTFLDPQNGPMGARMVLPAAPAQPQKVDVNGTVQGQAELHTTTAIEVEPSPYFVGLVKRIEGLATMNLSGSLGHDMAGSNAPIHVAPAGIGHM